MKHRNLKRSLNARRVSNGMVDPSVTSIGYNVPVDMAAVAIMFLSEFTVFDDNKYARDLSEKEQNELEIGLKASEKHSKPRGI